MAFGVAMLPENVPGVSLQACADGPYTGELPPLWDGAAGPRIAEAIVTYAEKNNYHHVVMGSAGRTGTARFLKGSVAQELVTLAHCPVTIAR